MSVSDAQLKVIRETVLQTVSRQLEELPAQIGTMGLTERDLEWALSHYKDSHANLGIAGVLSRLAGPLLRSTPVSFPVYRGDLATLAAEVVGELKPEPYAEWGEGTPFPLQSVLDPEVPEDAIHELVWFEKQINLDKVADVLRERGYEPATLREVLSLISHNPSAMKEVWAIFGLGSTWSQVKSPDFPYETWIFPSVCQVHPQVKYRKGLYLSGCDQRSYAVPRECQFLARKMQQ